MKRQIKISGTMKFHLVTGPFTGTVAFDEGENSIYYSWNIYDNERKCIAHRSRRVSLRRIPDEQDIFEYAKAHAIEGIRKYRIGREKIILEVNEC